MSLMSKIQEALAANPGVSWNDLVLSRLRTATSSTDGTVNDLWMRWLESQGYTLGSLNDRMASYWRVQGTPLNERNAFYFGYTAFFAGPVATVPGAPTIGTATAGNAQATVTFTAPASDGGSPITGYRVTSTPGGITATGVASPITVTGLTNDTAYTFTVAAQNVNGFGAESAASNSVTPSSVTLALTSQNIAILLQQAGIRLGRNGVLSTLRGITFSPVAGQWVSSGASATIGDAYEAIATIISGTAAEGTATFGAALRLNVDRTWAIESAGSFLVIIRQFGGGDPIVSATFTIS